MSAKTAIEKAVAFIRGRIVRMESEIVQWGRDTDETAALAKIPSATVRGIRGVGRAQVQIEKAKRELANGNLLGAVWHLDQAQGIYSMQRLTGVSLTRVVEAAEEGQKIARGRSAGGKKTGGARTREAVSRDEKLKAAAQSVLAENPRLSNGDLARILADRGHGGKEAIRKKLARLLGK